MDLTAENAAGFVAATEPVLSNEYILVTAHVDHVGTGAAINGDSVYNGALDNASGIGTLIELAKQVAAKPTRRNIIFAAVTAEEQGLLGSQHLAAHNNLPRAAIIGTVNIDMFLPLHPFHTLTVYGLNESNMRGPIERVAKRTGLKIEDDPEPKRLLFVRSDQYSFIRAGIPSVALDFGYKGGNEEKLHKQWIAERYHAPSDDLKQPIDLEAAAAFNQAALAVARELGDAGERPRWNESSFFKRFEVKK
jgi:Zn-dependent M28 family amino/carboxypeptidase